MIFRSKAGRFDVFDWTTDYLKLPTVPTAIHAFGGRIWVFDETHIYRINPSGLFIEDIYDGVGAYSQESVCVTEYGMFIADRNNMYWHDGQKPTPIGNAVLNRTDAMTGITDYSYKTLVGSLYGSLTPWVFYDAVNGYVCFLIPFSSVLACWGFHIAKKRWDFFTFSFGISTTGVGFVRGVRGELYHSNTTKLYKLFDSAAARTTFTWISLRFPGESDAIYRKFYKVKLGGSGCTATYSVDEGAFSALTAGALAAGDRLKRTLRVKITSALAADYVTGLTVIYRELIGRR
jgi:hypothetical protein